MASTIEEPLDRKWAQQLVLWREQLGVSKTFCPFDQLGIQIRGCNVTRRIRGILNCVVAARLKGEESRKKKHCLEKLKGVMVDVSQNPVRRAFTPAHGINHTLCTSSTLVDLEHGRSILPAEHFLFQGHNIEKLQFPREFSNGGSISNKQYRQLAGEGMSLPCLGVVIMSLLLNGNLTAEIGLVGAA